MANLTFSIKTSADLKAITNTKNEIQGIVKSAKDLLKLRKERMDSVKSTASTSGLERTIRLQQAQDRLELSRMRERRQQESHITTEKNKQLAAIKKQLDVENALIRNQRNRERALNPLGGAGRFSGFGGGLARGVLFGSTSIFTTGTIAGAGFGIGLGAVQGMKLAYQKLNEFTVEGINLTKQYEQRWVSLAGLIGQFNNTTLPQSIALSKKWTDQLAIQSSVFNITQEEMHQTALAMSVVGSSFEDIVKYGAKYAALIKLLTFGQPFERQIGSETRAALGQGTITGAVLVRQQQFARGGSTQQIQEQNALLLKQGKYWQQLEQDMAPVMKAQEELRKTYEAQLNIVKELGNIEIRNLFSDTAGGYKALIESIAVLKQQRLLYGEQAGTGRLMLEEWQTENPSLFKSFMMEQGKGIAGFMKNYTAPGIAMKWYNWLQKASDITATKPNMGIGAIDPGLLPYKTPLEQPKIYTKEELLTMTEDERLAIQTKLNADLIAKTSKESGALPTIDLKKLEEERIKQGLLSQSRFAENRAFQDSLSSSQFDLDVRKKQIEYKRSGKDFETSSEYKRMLQLRSQEEGILVGKARQRLAIEQKLVELDSSNEEHIKNVKTIQNEIQNLIGKRLSTLMEIENINERSSEIDKAIAEIEKEKLYTAAEFRVIDAETLSEKIEAQKVVLENYKQELEAQKSIAITEENRLEIAQKIAGLEIAINRETRTYKDYVKSKGEADFRSERIQQNTIERLGLYKESGYNQKQLKGVLQRKSSAVLGQLQEFGVSPADLDAGNIPFFGESTDKQKELDDLVQEAIRLQQAFRDLRSPIQDAASDLRGLVQGTLQGFSQIIASGENVSEAIRALFSNIASQIANMGINMMLNSLFPSGKNSGVGFSTFAGLAGSAFGGLAGAAGSAGSAGGGFDYFTGEGLDLSFNTSYFGATGVKNSIAKATRLSSSMSVVNVMPPSSNVSEKMSRAFIRQSSSRGNWFDKSVTIKKPKDTL